MAVTIGVRELRSNLRAYLERVKAGEEVVVTERGRPVARISAPLDPLDQLVAEGRVRPPTRAKRPIELDGPTRLEGRPDLSDFVIEQHGH